VVRVFFGATARRLQNRSVATGTEGDRNDLGGQWRPSFLRCDSLFLRPRLARVEEKISGLERPSNGDVEPFREYKAHIGQMIFAAFDIRGTAPRRNK
jgi:hypothetical protein